MAAVFLQSVLLLSGCITPLALFLPGSFVTMAQGISLPFAQSGAMATIPRLAGTAAGISVFLQNFCGGGFAYIYGFVADGSSLGRNAGFNGQLGFDIGGGAIAARSSKAVMVFLKMREMRFIRSWLDPALAWTGIRIP